MALAMTEIEDAIADPRGGAIGRHIAEPHRHHGLGLVGGDGQLDQGGADDGQRRLQRLGIEDQGAGIVEALIQRQLRRHLAQPIGAPFPAASPVVWGERKRSGRLFAGFASRLPGFSAKMRVSISGAGQESIPIQRPGR